LVVLGVSNSVPNIHIAFGAVQGAGHFRVSPVAVGQQYCAMHWTPRFMQTQRIQDQDIASTRGPPKRYGFLQSVIQSDPECCAAKASEASLQKPTPNETCRRQVFAVRHVPGNCNAGHGELR
jgi:hypothetical protein